LMWILIFFWIHQVNFEGLEQKILAVQAPKPDMFSGFWQLVVDQNVSLIIMITKLVENQKRKAHQYWPEEVGQEMKLEHGVRVKYENEEVSDGIYKRKFTVAGKGDL
jgi:protein tyrosine phosphatase